MVRNIGWNLVKIAVFLIVFAFVVIGPVCRMVDSAEGVRDVQVERMAGFEEALRNGGLLK